MRKKILSVLICGLLIGTIFVIAPSDLKIKSVSADIIEDNSKLDYSTIYEITEKLSFVINDPNVYEEDELERGRAFGSEGELETAFNILEPVLNGILGEENVECEQLESYSELSSNLEVNSLGITIKDIEAVSS